MGWLAQLFSRRHRYDELSETIREHLDEKIADLMDRGMTQEQAEQTARREFGNVARIEERSREVWQWQTLESFWADIKYSFRQLRKSRGFTITAILMLALGIGASTAIFSIIEGVLLRPLPFPNSDRLVVLTDMLYGASPDGSGLEAGVTSVDLRNYTRYTHDFASLGGFKPTSFQLSDVGDAAVVDGARMGNGVFSTLGVSPIFGRIFTQQEDEQGQHVVILSYATWKSRFHGDSQVLGKKILLDRSPYVVIGVMPRSFEFPLVPGHLNRSELWVPLSLSPHELASADSWNLQMIGRLKTGIDVKQARDDAERVALETMRSYPASIRNIRISAMVKPLREETVEAARSLLRILFLAVIVVLAIACANLAGLLLIRAIRRRKELAVRLALGAPVAALVRQTMLESLVLSITGGVLGLGIAAIALRVGVGLLPETLPRVSEIGLDVHVAVFALLLAIVTGLACGIVPAVAAMHTSVNDALKEGGRTGMSSGGQARLRSALVIGEIAIALALLTASGLLLRSFQKARSVDLGFRPNHAVTAAFGLLREQYATQTAVDAFDNDLLRRLRQLPGVEAVGLTSSMPASGEMNQSAFVVDNYVPRPGAGLNMSWPSQVLGDYFRAMGIRLMRGRFFTEDDTAKSQLVAIVNHKLAKHYWPGENPIGKRLRWGVSTSSTPWMTVVGEVSDVKQSTPDGEAMEQIYQPWTQNKLSYGTMASPTDLTGNYGYVVLRTSLPPEQIENALRETVRSIDSQLPLTQVQTMEHAVSETEAPRWFNTVLISSFAIAALLLAALGIYSVIAFSVAMREQEMAIRMALGSQRSGILSLILASGAKLAAVGCILGLLGAGIGSHLLRSFLFGVSPFDPVVFACSVAVMLILTLIASALPARRAAKTDPLQALRSE